MTWSTNVNPKQEGWYLVTVDDRYVMPAYRMEYPKGNFTWKDNVPKITATMKFPKPYKAKIEDSWRK